MISMNLTCDYFNIDELLSDENKLIRQSIRDFVSTEIKPVINDAAQHHHDIPNLMLKLGAIGALGPYIPQQYGEIGRAHV